MRARHLVLGSGSFPRGLLAIWQYIYCHHTHTEPIRHRSSLRTALKCVETSILW
jgi:hypothetical protein